MRWLAPLLLTTLAFAADPKAQGADAMDAVEQEERRTATMMREAAEYRLARAQTPSSPADESALQAQLAEAERMRRDGGRAWYHLWMFGPLRRARWIAEDAFDDHPFAASAGRALHFVLECHAEDGSVRSTLDQLQRLWYYLPDYPDLRRSMFTTLEMAERLQRFETAVDLEAEDPRQVVRIDGRGFIFDLDDVFRFLAEHGDRDDIAPRAALGLARTLLISGDKEDRWRARRAYEDFLEKYPESPLVFTAILEQALSHLITYKGADYDVGALLDARDLVDIAELEAGGDPERAATVAAFRKRIGGWLQDRDLSVATWYAHRTRPWWLAWLKRPTELKGPDAGARFYAGQVIRRDRASAQAGQAQLLLERVSPPAGMPPR